MSAALVRWELQAAMISDAEPILAASFLWKPTLTLSLSARWAKQGPSGPGPNRAGLAELTAYAWKSMDTNHQEISTQSRRWDPWLLFPPLQTVSFSITIHSSPFHQRSYRFRDCNRSREISQSTEIMKNICCLREVVNALGWQNVITLFTRVMSPDTCGTELIQLTCCQRMKAIKPSESQCIIKMQILWALCSSNWIISNYMSQKSGIYTVYVAKSSTSPQIQIYMNC